MNFKQFEQYFQTTQDELCNSIKAFSWADKASYAAWLANTYHYVNNSTRILALAGAHMPEELTALSNRFISHASEETGHEMLLQRDLKSLGYRLDEIPVAHEMKIYHRSLYFWMSPAGDPVGLIGWVLSLEGVAAKLGPWAHQLTLKAHGNKATNFLRVHAEEDPDHVAKALKVTSMLDPEHLALVADSLLMYSEQYTRILEASNQHRSVKKVA